MRSTDASGSRRIGLRIEKAEAAVVSRAKTLFRHFRCSDGFLRKNLVFTGITLLILTLGAGGSRRHTHIERMANSIHTD
jgi:hypothetical protein